MPSAVASIVPLQYDVNNVVPKSLVAVYDTQSDAGSVQPTGTDFKSTSLKLLAAVSHCKDSDHALDAKYPDGAADAPCADALTVRPLPPLPHEGRMGHEDGAGEAAAVHASSVLCCPHSLSPTRTGEASDGIGGALPPPRRQRFSIVAAAESERERY